MWSTSSIFVVTDGYYSDHESNMTSQLHMSLLYGSLVIINLDIIVMHCVFKQVYEELHPFL